MKYLAALVSLIATASAIDLYLHTNNDCGDSSLRCNGINPNVCCGLNASNSPYQSVAVRGIPAGWQLQCRGYSGGLCANLISLSGNNGNDWICNRSNGFRYSGVGYNFVGKKRGESSAAATSQEQSDCKRPDALVLADGTEYDLTGLSDDDFNSLVAVGLKAQSSADVPEQLQPLRIK